MRLRYCGRGRFQTLTKADFEMAESHYSVGDKCKSRQTSPRTAEQGAYFHAMVQLAFENQNAGPSFEHWRQLKGWLLVAVGHVREARIEVPTRNQEVVNGFSQGLAKALRSTEEYVGVAYDLKTSEIVIRHPGTTKVGRDRMSELIEATKAKIVAEIMVGADPDALFEMAKQRAA